MSKKFWRDFLISLGIVVVFVVVYIAVFSLPGSFKDDTAEQQTDHQVSEILETLSAEEFESLIISGRWRFGAAEAIGLYQLRSLDAGETWYVLEGINGEEKFLGPAEEIYPGLVAYLDASQKVTQHVDMFGVIPSDRAYQTEEVQVLLAARDTAWERFKELNKKKQPRPMVGQAESSENIRAFFFGRLM